MILKNLQIHGNVSSMPSISSSKRMALFVMGDVITYLFSLVLTLTLRYSALPSRALLNEHALSFTILILVFLLINLSVGLYDRRVTFLRNGNRNAFVSAQIAAVVAGVIFFYFAPVDIAPKANLIIYFVLSTVLLYVWRVIMFPVVSHSRRQRAILIGRGAEMEDLYAEINENGRYGLYFAERIIPEGSAESVALRISETAKKLKAQIIVADLYDRSIEEVITSLYSMIFAGVQVIDAERIYESIFDRVPLSIVRERWLVEHSNSLLGNRVIYDFLKRTIDIIISAIAGLVSLIFYPFVYLAIKFEDGGALFTYQRRVGKNGKPVEIVKIRSMSGEDQGRYAPGDGGSTLTVTKVGKFIRASRIDELPQLWNVLKGDLSLIGPRPEFPALVDVYTKEIPYYNARHLVKPGLSGWAQIYHQAHPHHAVDTTEAANKLSYDLFYVKNRSFGLDLRIVLRTIQVLLKRVGR